MARREYTDKEIDELDGFLQHEFNYKIYEQLTGQDYEDYKDLFDPLDFFRQFYKHVQFIGESTARPLFVSRQLAALGLADEQSWFLLHHLMLYFNDEVEGDEKLKICVREITKLRDSIDAFEEPEDDISGDVQASPYDFDSVREHIAALPTYREKIAYLIERRADYQQNRNGLLDWEKPNFAEKCNLEIAKLEKLSKLQPRQSQEGSQTVDLSKHKDARLDRVVLALNYLLNAAGVNDQCPKSKRINFIDFVSPYSRNTIKSQLDHLHEKADGNYVEYERDLALIRRYFEDLGLTKIVQQIDRDLKFTE